MPTEQYHEPPSELGADVRTFARVITSLTEESEAIGWDEERLALETDREAREIMENAPHEGVKHLGMGLEFLLPRKARWRGEPAGLLLPPRGHVVDRGGAGRE